MKPYPKERKAAVIERMAAPDPVPIKQLAKEENISEGTLYNWRAEARAEGKDVPGPDDSPEGWDARRKFDAVLRTAGMAEIQRAGFCRENGLFPEQLQRWRKACEEANEWDKAKNKELEAQARADKRRIRELEKDLGRKDKALAEAAAIIVLRKKLEAILEDGEN